MPQNPNTIRSNCHPSPFCKKTESIRFKDLPDPFVLKHWPPIRDSEHITINGTQLTKNLDYLIDYGAGTLRFLKDYPPDAIVQITYRVLPFAIKKGYKRDLFRQDQPMEQPPSEVKLETRTDLIQQRPPEPALPPVQVTGTHTFGVSAGSKRALSQERACETALTEKYRRMSASLHSYRTRICPSTRRHNREYSRHRSETHPHHKPKCDRIVGRL